MLDEHKRVLQFVNENKGSENNLESVVRSWYGTYKDLPSYQQANNIQANQISQLQKDLNVCLLIAPNTPKTATDAFKLFIQLLFKT